MFDKKNFGISIEKRNIFFYLHHRVIMEKWHTLQLKVKKELNGSNDKNQCLYVLYQNELITLLTDTTIYQMPMLPFRQYLSHCKRTD